MLRSFAAIACALSMTYAHATEVISSSPESVEVVIYRDQTDADIDAAGLGMISETRTANLPAGVSTLRFRGVAETIVPQTASFESLPAELIESNFDYNLITPANLIAASIGKRVRLVRTDRDTGTVTEREAILRSGPHGVLLDIGGNVEALNCSGLDERIVFDSVPATLSDTPTLSVTVKTSAAGRYRLRLSYLVLGLNWSADYVARIRPDGRSLDLSAWITLTNHLATSFRDATVHVVAGNLSRETEATRPVNIDNPDVQTRCWPIGSFVTTYSRAAYAAAPLPMLQVDEAMDVLKKAITVTAKARTAVQSELGDYKLYTLPEATTVAANQSKQVLFVDKKKVRFERVYTYIVNPAAFPTDGALDKPRVALRLKNNAKSGLGKPLPAGTVSVLETNSKMGSILAGQQTIQDIPVDSPADIEIGGAMNVWIEPRVMSDESIQINGAQGRRMEVEVGVRNDKPATIQLELRHEKYFNQAIDVLSESKPHTQKFGAPLWSYSLESDAREVLRYTIEQIY